MNHNKGLITVFHSNHNMNVRSTCGGLEIQRTTTDFEDFTGLVKGNFFQSYEFQQVLHEIGWRPIGIEFRNGNNFASAIAYSQDTMPLYNRVFSFYRVFYGPCMSPSNKKMNYDVLDLLLKKLCIAVKHNGGFCLEVRTPFPYRYGSAVFHNNGFMKTDFKGQYSVIIDLNRGIDLLWKDMKKFARRNIDNAIKKRVEIRGVETESELRQFYRIYIATSTRRDFTALPFQFFEALWNRLEPKGLVKYFLAWWKKKPIAGILNTFYLQQSVPYVACSLDNFWNLHPNHLLFWHSLKWSKEVAGSTIFNLYHLPLKKDKTESTDYHTFKTCFGGRIVEECAYYRKVISPIRCKMLELYSKKLHKLRPSGFVSRSLL